MDHVHVGVADMPMAARLKAIWNALDQVTDPEIPVVTLRELGILRAVQLGDDGVPEVVITPTYSGCPAMEQMADDVRAALAQAGQPARLVTQLSPAWTTDWITPAARDKLKAFGIAPPAGSAHVNLPGTIQFSRRSRQNDAIACPQCGSDQTTEISPFGSTACKAQYRCLACMEPFDYFKPY